MKDLFQKRFLQYKDLAEKTFAQLSDEQLFWQPNPESNSVAIIVQHLAGNMLSRWTNFLTEDGEKTWRNRDSEFVTNLKSRAEMLDYWEKGWAVFSDALNQITDENLYSEITIRSEKHSVLDAVFRQLAHYPYHIGQIVYIAKILKNDEWQTLSVPRNKSEEHNQMMREKFSNGQNNPLDSGV